VSKRALFALALAFLTAPFLRAAEPVVRWVDFEDKFVLPGYADRITSAIDDAEKNGESLVVIQLDTPGGLVATTHDLVKRMLASKVPIVVWVGPSGAHAGSAGFFLLLAADVAAMAPGTRAGAAATVYGGGKSEEGDVLLKKMNNDSAALLRSIAEHRGRNVEACEKAVLAAEAYSDTAALATGIIDLVAKDREDLLQKLDGREVRRFDGTPVVLATAGARIETTEVSYRQAFLEFIASPYVAYFLLLLGLGGLYVEMTHPGLVFPGVVGVAALILFALASQILPVSTIGVLLLLLGIVLLLLEIKVTSYGMLSVGGVACLLIGSLMLFNGPIPELRLPLAVTIPPVLALGALCICAVRLAVAAQRVQVATGVEGLAGEIGAVTRDLDPEGRVFVHGESWRAVSAAGSIPAGAKVRVLKVDHLQLTVEPAGDAPA